ncbi:MAG: TFIIB-type zinc finger domain-containing protein [Anaerotignum faecicola]|uniref:TFIIB-type zinc finger domain-containing protein n=1 Tax=Clostridium sp. MCC345 TaxID=2592645 RepID=UPI001C028677|nr:hypothetical protein [Clostridium sp. MCC345]
MKQIVCPNCGANDFVIKDGYKVCSYCDTKFEIKNKTKVAVSLEDDVQQLLQKCKMNPANARRYANLILEIDPNNKEAMKYL